jgi:hypothetical protein
MGAGIAPTDPFIPLPGYKQITLGQQIGKQQTLTVADGSQRGRSLVPAERTWHNGTFAGPT